MLSSWGTAVAMAVLLTQGGEVSHVETASILARLDRAAEFIVSEDASRAQQGMTELLDVLAALSSKIAAPEVDANVTAARRQLTSGPEAAATSLRAAYKSLTGRAGPEMPVVDEVSQLIASIRRQMDAARESLKSNRIRDSVRTLLEVALLIMTPVQ